MSSWLMISILTSVLIHPLVLCICSSVPQESGKFLQQILIQSQFSLGCALSCSLHFLHEGAAQRWLCLLLAAALSWFLARQTSLLLHHVMALYKLHSSQRYCGICISLLSSGRRLLPVLCRTMIITFCVAVVAAISIINKHFLSATEALRFWTPLTICYTLLVVYMQGMKHFKWQTYISVLIRPQSIWAGPSVRPLTVWWYRRLSRLKKTITNSYVSSLS